MSASGPLFAKEPLINAIKDSNEDLRVKMFQVLDTSVEWLRQHVYAKKPIPCVHMFILDPTVAQVAIYIEGFVKSYAHDFQALEKELLSIHPLRPQSHGPKAYSPLLSLVKTTDGDDPSDNDTIAEDDDDIVGNYDQAVKLQHKLDQQNNRVPRDETCDDMPQTDKEREAFVTELVAAMKDFSNIMDRPGKKQAATCDPTYVARVKNTSDTQLRVIAWKIQRYTEDAQKGLINLPSQYRKTVQYVAYPTYQARHKAVVDSLKRSKALVANQMTWDLTRRLVNAPEKETTLKKHNKEINDKRGVWIVKGKEVEAATQAGAGSAASTADPASLSSTANDKTQDVDMEDEDPATMPHVAAVAGDMNATVAITGQGIPDGGYSIRKQSTSSDGSVRYLQPTANSQLTASTRKESSSSNESYRILQAMDVQLAVTTRKESSSSSDNSERNQQAANIQLARDAAAAAIPAAGGAALPIPPVQGNAHLPAYHGENDDLGNNSEMDVDHFSDE